MKICILAPENSPSAGGVGAYTYNLARLLSGAHDVHVVSARRDSEDSLEELLPDTCTVTYVMGSSADDTFLYNAKFQLRLATFLGRYIRENGIEILHSHSGHVPHLFSQYLTQTPLVSTVHATIRGLRNAIRKTSRRVFAETMVDILAPAIEMAETAGFSKADRLLPVSQFTLRQLTELYDSSYARKAEILRNAVDPEMFAPSETADPDSPLLLNVARPHGIKGLEVFLEAVARLRRTHSKLTAEVVGYQPTSLDRAAGLDLPGVGFRGRLRYSDMPALYNRSTLVVVTSAYENCPGVVLEAMACGRVVVAPRVGGIPEILQDGMTGCLYDMTNPDSLRGTIADLIARPELVRQIGSKARGYVAENYSWHKRLSRVVAIYREVLNEDSPG